MAFMGTLDENIEELRNAEPEKQAHSLLAFLEYADGDAVAEAIRTDPSLISSIVPEFAFGVGYEQNNPNHKLTLAEHELLTMSVLPPKPILRLAGLLHDVGKPLAVSLDDDGNCHYHGHMEIGAEICERAGKAIGMEPQDLELLVFLVRNHDRRPRPGKENARRFIELCETRERLELLLALMEADMNAHSEKGAKRLADIMEKSLQDVNEMAICSFNGLEERRN